MARKTIHFSDTSANGISNCKFALLLIMESQKLKRNQVGSEDTTAIMKSSTFATSRHVKAASSEDIDGMATPGSNGDCSF
jgi:hypothetical protein